METDDVGVRVEILAEGAGIGRGFVLASDDGGIVKGEILVFEFGIGAGVGEGVGEIKGYRGGDVESVKVSAAEKLTFDECDAFFGFSEIKCGRRAGRATADNDIAEIVFFSHPYIILSRFS